MSGTLQLSAETIWRGAEPVGLSVYAQQLDALEKQSRRGETARFPPTPFDDLSVDAARAVLTKWNRPCEGAFEFLAAKFPHELAKLIELGRLQPPDLTFAAEALGRSELGWLVRHTLRPLLAHASAVVREGAIYGLQKHIDGSIREALSVLSRNDPSQAVRMAAEDALSES